ncbi:MAG: GGDEF domain-containing protein, partial [Granulosicoccaceae bacterium]
SRLATTDSLTGVRSKRYLLDHGQKFFHGAKNQPVTAMIMDIDFFKKINDELGHLTGDHVLAGLGELLNQMFPDDMVVRFGGEEFSVIFANTDCERGRQLGEQLRQKVEQLCPAGVDITVSVGVASTSNHPTTDLTGLLAHADKALYAAKERGRNRVCIATDNGPQDAVAASA